MNDQLSVVLDPVWLYQNENPSFTFLSYETMGRVKSAIA